jgi:glycosyltransferase involved in cell wall biosynthesis
MCAYNTAAFIAEAIESVLASSYEHLELIIVDDCSGDQTHEIALGYQQKDQRVKVYRNASNLGDYNNRNMAASYAAGEYLKYLDADDIIYPDSLRIMVSAMERYPEAGLGLQQFVFDDVKPYPILVTPGWIVKAHFLERSVIGSGPSGAIIKTKVFKEMGGFSGEEFVGDHDLWFRIVFKYPMVLLQPSLVWWRVHEGQESVTEANDKKMMLVRYNLYKKFLKDPACPLINNDRERAIWKLNRRFLMNVFNKLRKGENVFYSVGLIREASLSARDISKAIFH